uniref:Cytochrome p450 n=1 Tax=Colletotrichum fructicola (strain Nara gc5) TaxID=1213859 RepID=L2FY41_COLFN
MSSQRFYLLGEDPSATTEIEIPASTDEEGLQHLAASHFAVVDHKGIGFVSGDEALTTVADVLAAEGPVALSIDGHAVREVPGPAGLPFIGNYFEVYPDHLGNHQRLFERYGPFIKTNNMGSVIYHTNDPKLANIVFSESDFFTKNIIPGHPLYPIKNQESGATVEDAFKVFDELDDKDEAWNVYPYMLKLGSQAVGKLVLGMDFKHFTAVDAPPHEMVIRIAQSLELNKKITSMGSCPSPPPPGGGTETLELQEAALNADNMVDYVLRAADRDGNKLPQDRIMEPLVVATGAGFTTTSSASQELIDNGFDENTQITAELTQKLTFLDKYIKETQRKHNPSYQPARTSKVDMVLPGGYKLPKDSIVIPAIHHIHNNTLVWDNPARFDPDRWDTEQVKNRPNASYIPFATGPRMCIGFNFALQEVKVFLPKLVYRYKFSLAQDSAVEYDPMFQLIRPNNLYVRAERRVKWPPRSDA